MVPEPEQGLDGTDQPAESVKAAQLIYTRVEADESPRGLTGYQAVYFTQPEITEDFANSIGSHLVYHGDGASPPKFVFYVADSEKYVVSKLVSAANPDRHGRLPFFAHSYVLSKPDLKRFNYNPIAVVRSARFYSTMAEAEAQTHSGSSHIEPARVAPPGDIEAMFMRAAQDWPSAELSKLVYLALRAKKLKELRQAVALVGSPEDITTLLALVHGMLPIEVSQACSFDTSFEECSLDSTYFWAVGLPKSTNRKEFIYVDIAGRQVIHDGTWKPANVFEEWLQQKLDNKEFEHVLRFKRWTYFLSRFLDGDHLTAQELSRIPKDLVACIQGKDERIQTRMRMALRRAVLRGMVPSSEEKKPSEVVAVYEQWADRFAGEMLTAAMSEYEVVDDLQCILKFEETPPCWDAASIPERLLEFYKSKDYRRPPSSELFALSSFLGESQLLRTLHLLWTQADNLRGLVSTLSDDEYRTVLRASFLNSYHEPLLLLDSTRLPIFLSEYCSSSHCGEIPLSEIIHQLHGSAETDWVRQFPGAVWNRLLDMESENEDIGRLRNLLVELSRCDEVPDYLKEEVEQRWQTRLDRFGFIGRARENRMLRRAKESNE